MDHYHGTLTYSLLVCWVKLVGIDFKYINLHFTLICFAMEFRVEFDNSNVYRSIMNVLTFKYLS